MEKIDIEKLVIEVDGTLMSTNNGSLTTKILAEKINEIVEYVTKCSVCREQGCDWERHVQV